VSSAPSYFVRSECKNGFVVHPGSLQIYPISLTTIFVTHRFDHLKRLQRHTIQQADRSKTLDAIKRHQDSINTKSKEITSIRQKLPYKNSSEIQARIQQLDGQIESGRLKLIDEKKALNEISTLKRSSKQVTTLESLETSIAEDKQQIETLRQVLDDPQAKATQARWDALKKEMDQLREEQKKAYDERGGLFDRRNELSRKMDELYERKRASNAKHRADNDA
jgi:chromosome segregation ATPase